MLRILTDCMAYGKSVHPGDVFPETDIPAADVSILIGLGFAELFTPEEPEKEPEKEPEPEQESPIFMEEDEPAPKSRKKSRK